MPDTRREQVLAALATRLGANATRDPKTSDFETYTTIGINESDEESEIARFGKVQCVLSVVIMQTAEIGANGGSVAANAVLGTLISTVTGTDRTLGGLCESIVYRGGAIERGPEHSKTVAAAAGFDITYQFDVGDPYNLT